MNKRVRFTCIGFLILIGTIGCGGFPSESAAQEKFERTKPWDKVVAAGAAKVKRFEKKEGLATEVAGVKHYKVWYQVEMECITPLYIVERNDNDYVVLPDDSENEGFKREMQGSYYTAQGIFVKEMKPGDVDSRSGTLEFTHFDSGWK